MNPIEKILNDFPIIIIDGAMATELENYGCNLNDRLWSAKILMENPELIKQVHLDYFKAGADCAITASYQATVGGYMERGLTKEEAIGLIKKSVQIATKARDEFWTGVDNQSNRPKPLVAASVGPYGAFLADGSEYRGDYLLNEDELVTFHRERIRILVEAGADILACETIPCLLEAKAITKVLKEFPGVYAWISFSAKDEFHTSNGDTIADCAKWLDGQEQVAAIGINCSSPIVISSLIKEIKGQTSKPIIVYPNSGDEYDATSKSWSETSSTKQFTSSTQRWYEAGAKLIGGCCRTRPEDIEAITAWARR
ncbi:homocysteine S-methyltransferase [Anaerobacillus alkalidiazotrophicus]|uniref:S-methylmethionine:homocysteine methyltransferase n=1 Tax=Anaerobacillus alkalidiazotrophicus TaxID=472963 RepID=A0A1S2MB34_9BACI|nr:homocysteine S-methyltransferase [Anaerobacillus alkalidiazotrophicus]OIJ21869.1 homocysteine S-methyltransferase [Anaerobacillus alkalidiazotrophicus]